LAEAIDRHAQAEQRVAQVSAAMERASGASSEAFHVAKQARTKLAEAQANERAHLAAVALGEADAASNSVADATLAPEQAETAREVAKRTREALKVEARAAESELAFATSHLNSAVRDVLHTAPEVQQLLADLDAAKRKIADILLKLFTLPAGVTGNLSWNLNEFQLSQQPPDPSWQSSIAALRCRADAPLLPQR
jgi:chromosome segregation ATPase